MRSPIVLRKKLKFGEGNWFKDGAQDDLILEMIQLSPRMLSSCQAFPFQDKYQLFLQENVEPQK